MKMKEVTVLVYQSIDEFNFSSFEHPIFQWVSNQLYPNFSLDSLSGSDIVSYTHLFIEKSERLVLLLLFDQSNNSKNLPSLLRKVSSKEETLIVSLGTNVLAEKMSTESFKTSEDLIERVENWINLG